MGPIPGHLKPILTRLNIEPNHWLGTVSKFQQSFGRVAGSITSLEEWRERYNKNNETNQKWFKGNKAARQF